jgi:hypothetical protein
MPWHPQVEVTYEGRTILVDEGMVDLLRACWSLGLKTYGSCQDQQRGSARIWFADEDSSVRFASLVPTAPGSGDGWPRDFPSASIDVATTTLDRAGSR